jgi:hypothetical protein
MCRGGGGKEDEIPAAYQHCRKPSMFGIMTSPSYASLSTNH